MSIFVFWQWKLSVKSSYERYSTINAKSLACDTANEHALTCSRETYEATVRQLSNGINGDDLCICIATLGNTIQTVNSPI